MKLASLLLLAASLVAHAEVKVGVGKVSDKRTMGETIGKFFGGLEVELKISGPEIAECKGLRVALTEAKDDTGKIVKQLKRFDEDRFMSRQDSGGFRGSLKKNEALVKLKFKNPEPGAKSLTIDGMLEIVVPSKDPASVVTVDLAKDAGKVLDQPNLKSLGVAITFKAAKNAEGSYTIIDPNNKVASVEFCSADGTALESNGYDKIDGGKYVTIHLEGTPGIAKIYLITDQSVARVPVKLDAIALP